MLEALDLNWPKHSELPDGSDPREVSLASVRDLAQHLGVSESTIRSSIQRLKKAALVTEYQLRDMDNGVRRLYFAKAQPEEPLTVADLLTAMFEGRVGSKGGDDLD
ncbi:hypothetical protein A5705_21305 [Mycobacterium sp. E787]|nr:hypothetical protein A5705_21305 [Mycobacterium sp. E787]